MSEQLPKMRVSVEELGHASYSQDMRDNLCFQAIRQIYTHWSAEEIDRAVSKYYQELKNKSQEVEQ